MTPEALRQAAITLFGERGWMSRLAEALGVDRSTVSRWFAGLPPPGPVVAAVRAWLVIHRLTGLRPDELHRLLPPPPSRGPSDN
jgi:transcriptional regulator with XRE-family HTH domain